MKKIKSLFKRDYKGDRLMYNEIVTGSEWVPAGEGIATVKYDGTCCAIRDGKLFKRYDQKLTKLANRHKKKNPDFVPAIEDFKPAPEGWEAAESEPDLNTGHWPGWLPVGDGPEDQYHRQALDFKSSVSLTFPVDGTYELVGPKIQGNPYNLPKHTLFPHGDFLPFRLPKEPPRDFEGLKEFFETAEIEGIVWHHLDGRMVKIKKTDFGFQWPLATA